jgi:hypothetical protein
MGDFSRAEMLTIPFLRMVALELRRIAERAPEVADQLRFISDKLDAEANDLSRYLEG